MTNLPAGQAERISWVTFGGTGAGTAANGVSFANLEGHNREPGHLDLDSNSVSTQLTIPNNYALVDNIQWLKGKHLMTFGMTLSV